MKKIFMFLMLATLFAACSSDNTTSGAANEGGDTQSTEVYAMGQKLASAVGTRAGNAASYADAYFFVRIDGRIPKQVGLYNSKEYWPQTYNGSSVFFSGNKGLVDTSYPYWKFYSENGYNSTREYLYDTSGKAVEKIIDKVPSFASMMKGNQKDAQAVAAIDTTNLKIIWYVAKFTYGKWHVDGVLTYNTVDNITEVPDFEGEKNMDDVADEPTLPEDAEGNIEVDIHQQEHSDWQEIKTSVHLRDLVDKLTVEIPLEYEHIAEADDFAIRTYDLELGAKVFINGTEYALDSANPVKVTIEHQANKAVFTIVCTDAKYLEALRKEYGDGVTVEIHTYPKNLTKEEVWAKLKQATVKVTPAAYKNLIYKGATSAFFNE